MASMCFSSPVPSSGPDRHSAVGGSLTASRALLGAIAKSLGPVRSASPDNRREPIVCLTEESAGLYNGVTGKRSRGISRVLKSLSVPDLKAVRIGFEIFAATGEPSADKTLVLGI